MALASPGPIFVPYCGDADIANELYAGRPIVGCDTDAARVDTANRRGLPNARFVEGDAETFDDFGDLRYVAADFDAYAYPYETFRNFMDKAQRAARLVLFFTDGELQVIRRRVPAGFRAPDGEHHAQLPMNENRAVLNNYWQGWALGYVTRALGAYGYHVVESDHYVRNGNVLYWGCVADTDQAAQVVENVESLKREARAPEAQPYNPSKAYKLTAKARLRFLDQLAHGKTKTDAARAIGVNLKSIERHEKADPAFASAIDDARWEADDAVVNSLYQAAVNGNVPAIQTWLYNRRPLEWSANRNRVTKFEVDDDALRLIVQVIRSANLDAESFDRIVASFARLQADGLIAPGGPAD